MIRYMRVIEGQSIWDDMDGVLVASLPLKFRMPNITITWGKVSSYSFEIIQHSHVGLWLR